MGSIFLLLGIWLIIGGLAATKLFPPIGGTAKPTKKTWAFVPMVVAGGIVSLIFSGFVVEYGYKTWKIDYQIGAIADGVCPVCDSPLFSGQPVCLKCGQATGL